MRKLIEYILEGILGHTDFDIEESETDGRIELTVKTDSENMGLIIGKGGSTIRSIRNLIRVRSTLEKKSFFLNVSERS